MKKLLLVALASALAFPSAAQTGRIAHFSHGGSATTLATEEKMRDNFGWVVSNRYEKLTRINDSVITVQGHRLDNGTVGPYIKQTIIYRPASCRMPLIEQLQQLHKQYPDAQFFGFDSISSPAKQGSLKLKENGRSQKPAGRTQSFPLRPFQYSYWRELTDAVAMGTVGWLLGKKRPA